MATTSKARSSMAANQWVSAATTALALTELNFDDGDGRNLSDFITDYFAEYNRLTVEVRDKIQL